MNTEPVTSHGPGLLAFHGGGGGMVLFLGLVILFFLAFAVLGNSGGGKQ